MNLAEGQFLLDEQTLNEEKTLIYQTGTRIIMESGLKIPHFPNFRVSYIVMVFLIFVMYSYFCVKNIYRVNMK